MTGLVHTHTTCTVVKPNPAVKNNKKCQLSLTNPRDACETFVSCILIANLPIDSVPMVSYYRPVVTLRLKCIVFAQYRL